jgi:hypothetical protein
MTVNIQAKFKRDQSHMDGLGAIAEELAKNPLQARIIVATVECTRVTHNVKDGTDIPTVKLTAVEVCEGTDAVQVSTIMERLYAARTGRDDLPQSLFDPPQPDERPADAPAESWPGDVDFTAPEFDGPPLDPADVQQLDEPDEQPATDGDDEQPPPKRGRRRS